MVLDENAAAQMASQCLRLLERFEWLLDCYVLDFFVDDHFQPWRRTVDDHFQLRKGTINEQLLEPREGSTDKRLHLDDQLQ